MKDHLDALDRIEKHLGIVILIVPQYQLLELIANKLDGLKILIEEKDKVIKRLLEKTEGEP